jgi:hypothetical protein
MNSNGESHSYLPDAQPQLFGGAVSGLTHQTAAEEPSSRLSLEARREVIMRIFGTADGHFVSSYVRCLVEYGLSMRTLSLATSQLCSRKGTAC